jgi:hypothetical protein
MSDHLTVQESIVAHLCNDPDILNDVIARSGSFDPAEHLKQFFHAAAGHSMRLTYWGHRMAARHYKGFTVVFEKHKFTSRQILSLAQTSRFPYYLQDSHFTTYDRYMGIKLKLASGELDRILQVLFD